MRRLLPLLLVWIACGGSKTNHLGPQAEARTSCLADVMAHPSKDPKVAIKAGMPAVDVPFEKLGGGRTSLGQILEKGPVLLVTGSSTCPVFQERSKHLSRIAERFAGRVQTVLVYTTEAHPSAEDPSPYTGEPWPLKFSDRGQSKSTAERVQRAGELALGDHVTVLVDPMDPGAADPFWCTYGPCPYCGFLLSPEGEVVAAHDWMDARAMGASIKSMLEERKAKR